MNKQSKNTKIEDILPKFDKLSIKITYRPTFLTKNNYPIRACGFLAFCRDPATEKVYFLMTNYHEYKKTFEDYNPPDPEVGYWEDLGGKTDTGDKCELDTASREAAEETNAFFHTHNGKYNKKLINNKKDIQSMLNKSQDFWKNLCKNKQTKSFYTGKSKYRTFLVELDIKWKQILPDSFWESEEIFEGAKRKIAWISTDDWLNMYDKDQLNERLINPWMKKVVESLNDDWQFDITKKL